VHLVGFAIELDNPISFFFSVTACLKTNHYRFFPHTVVYARTNVIGSRISFVIASARSSIYWNICI